MTEPKAWHCPNCNAYHAPHVDTCPKPKTASGSLGPGGQFDAFSLDELRKQQAAALRGYSSISEQTHNFANPSPLYRDGKVPL